MSTLFYAALITIAVAGVSPSRAEESCHEHLPYGAPTLTTSVPATFVCHDGYATAQDNEKLVPRWVAYELTGLHTLGCNKRGNDFHADALLPADHRAKPSDYAKSGYDKGHLAPAEDFAWDADEMHDSFSMANMTPQLPHLNRDEWERLEETVRVWAWQRGKLLIYVGPIFADQPSTIGSDQVAVPAAFWKVIIDTNTHEAIAFVMPQRGIAKGDLHPWEQAIAYIENTASIKLPMPTEIDIQTMPPLWSADMTGWRMAHRQACAN